MGTHDRRIDHGADVFFIDSDCSENVRPNVFPSPVPKPVVGRFPRAKSFWQIAPWRTSLCNPNDRIHKTTITVRWSPASSRYERLNLAPLLIGQLMTASHAPFRSNARRFRYRPENTNF